MAFDYKKEYREFYLPKERPEIVTVPPMNYIAVRGKGDPNIEDGEYQAAMGMLYGVAFTIKMSKKGSHCIEGYFDYVVPPLEGFWWQEGIDGVDFAHKDEFNWISVIRLPDFVTKEDFHWAVEEAAKKKKRDFSKAEFLTVDEGLCVQMMHIGPFDDEPRSVALMDRYIAENGYENAAAPRDIPVGCPEGTEGKAAHSHTASHKEDWKIGAGFAIYISRVDG